MNVHLHLDYPESIGNIFCVHHQNNMTPKLPTRQLGKDGPLVTALGYGAMGLSAYYAPAAPDEERLQFLDHVYNSGILSWDTSDVYGDSEELLGKWFSRTGKRNEIFLATKGGGGLNEKRRSPHPERS